MRMAWILFKIKASKRSIPEKIDLPFHFARLRFHSLLVLANFGVIPTYLIDFNFVMFQDWKKQMENYEFKW